MGCIIDELPEAELFECYTHGENFGNYDNFKSKVTQGATEKSQFKTLQPDEYQVNTFKAMDFDSRLQANIDKAKYTAPTAVQKR